MKQISIIGADTFLGEHLLTAINDSYPGLNKKIWNYNEGLDGISDALSGSDTVINLHEVQDFSLSPNLEKLQKNNVDFISELLNHCKLAGCSLLVHLSSAFLQCSTKWPNVFGREAECFGDFRAECPFPAYCESKYQAERLLTETASEKFVVLIARVGPIYGEGDRHSLVCDALLAREKFYFLPIVGNSKDRGVLQFTYAGNVGHALLSCARRMLAYMTEEKVTNSASLCETVLICDDTPVRDFYSFVFTDLLGEDAAGSTSVNIGDCVLPFWFFFLPYTVLCLLAQLLGGTVFKNLSSRLERFPSPNFFYLLLRHWTFFSSYKLRVFFDFLPPYDWRTSLERSRSYYKQLKHETIDGPSWRSSE